MRRSATVGPSSSATPATFTKLGEGVRKMAPHDMACQWFCGGSKCKYDSDGWPQTDMAIDGIFSHW